MRAGPNQAAALFGVLLLLLAAGCASAPPPVTTRSFEFPAPFQGPGVPEAPPGVTQAVRDGWRALLAGDVDGALAASRRAGAHPLASLLAYDVALAEGAAGLVAPIRQIAEANPRWAAAWITLSFAAEREQDPALAVRAARTGVELWPEPRWKERLATLERRLVGTPLAEAREALAAKDAARALELARTVLAQEPSNAEAALIAARALAGLHRRAEARKLLAPLVELPEAAELAARLAEEDGDWAAALSLYQALPRSWPGRARTLARVKLMWRLQNLPAFVTEALESPRVTRAQMAAILVALAPQVEALAAGPAPLMSDIVGLPEQREILAVVRAGIMRPSGTPPSFRPAAPLAAEEAAAILGRLAQRLDAPLPPSCAGTASAGCLRLEEPVTGGAVKRAIWGILYPEDMQ